MLSKDTWKTSDIRSLNNRNEAAHNLSEIDLQKELSLFANTQFTYKSNYSIENHENHENNARPEDTPSSSRAPNNIHRDSLGDNSNDAHPYSHIETSLRNRANIPFLPNPALYLGDSRLSFNRGSFPQDSFSQYPQLIDSNYNTDMPNDQHEHFSSMPCSPVELRQNPMNMLYAQNEEPIQRSSGQFSSTNSESSPTLKEDEANNDSEGDSNQSQENLEPNKIDKRRRNTAASARFRVKKKIREQFLQKTLDEKTESAEKLQERIVDLEREIKWLKDLIMEKDSNKSPKEKK
ncbi:hypothetical protein CLU79DRAFT_835665 [Phycomyces nitens]|nr:hypothetical protein CLU79DRAFT_835665 [Phycomyces nitens]